MKSTRASHSHAAEDFASGTALHRNRSPADLRAERGAMGLSLVVAILLLGVKLTAYYLTGSAAIFSDAVEGLVNVVAAGIGLYALWLAHLPPDVTHPYGHGKVEFFSAGLEGGMILLAAVVVAVRAVDVMINQVDAIHVDQLHKGLWLMGLALAVNGGLGTVLVRFGRARGSIALEADGWHLLGDAITSAAAMLAVAGVRVTHIVILDPIAALLVAIYIGWTGVRLIARSTAGLMDQTDIADDRMLRALLDSHMGSNAKSPQICGYHKLRHRHSGRYHWVDFHVHLPSHLDVRQSHEIASKLEYEIESALGEGNATAHVEPCELGKCTRCDSPAKE